jgi:hypothetical protein
MKKLLIIFGLGTILIGFQNCAPTMHFDPAEGSSEFYGKAAVSSEVIPSQTGGQEVVVDENHGDVIGVIAHEEELPAQQAEQQEEQHQDQVIEQPAVAEQPPVVAEHQEQQMPQQEEQPVIAEQQPQAEQQDQTVADNNQQAEQQTETQSAEETQIDQPAACNVEKVTVKFKESYLFIGEYSSDKKNADEVDVKKIIVDLMSGDADLYNPKKLMRSCTLNAEQLAELKSFACECLSNGSAPNCDNYSKKLSQELRKELKRIDDCTKVEGQDEGKAQASDMQANSHGKKMALHY